MSTTALTSPVPSVLPSLPVNSADALLSQAVAAGASIDTLERLMALRESMLAEKAKEAFNIAMAAFQAECPVIVKTKGVKTKNGVVAYRYAPIDSIVEQEASLAETWISLHRDDGVQWDKREGDLPRRACDRARGDFRL